ncbi:MAG: DUF3040 domain-containing protein [Geminicoccaceae bacterium]|nr:DUF3040 domain-containing protein [Geminicoccaceae bacterium]
MTPAEYERANQQGAGDEVAETTSRTSAERSTPRSTRDDPPFDQLIAIHRGARRGFLVYAVLLAIVGAALLVAGLAGKIPWLIALVTGVIALVVAIFPYRQSIERRERIEGLQVLAEEWRDIVARSADPVGARERFMGLLERLYAPEKRMGA